MSSSTTKDIASARKQNKANEPWSHNAAAKACLKHRRKLTEWEIDLCRGMVGWQYPTPRQLDSLRFCCRKVGVRQPDDWREAGDR
jgi:hypothetical protein